MAKQNAPAALRELRQRLDALDAQVLDLLAKRMSVVKEVAAVKRAEGVPIRDFQREHDLLADRRARAAALGLPEGPIESVYRQLMLASRDLQAALGAAAPTALEPKRIVIVGGAGQMGALTARLFRDLGHRVVVADVATEIRAERAVPEADVVVIAVPITRTLEVIEEVGPHVRADSLLMDITSIKGEPLAAMLRHSRASVIGTHPMFGPGVHSLQGQRFVLCEGRGEEWRDWLTRMLEARGLIVGFATAQEHDRAMAVVQVLTHFQTQVFGWALSRSGVPLEQSRRFTSPAYLMELYVAARHFAQDPGLYGPIEMLNPDTKLVSTAFRRATEDLCEILEQRDQARFEQMFAEVRAFFGEFAVEAAEQSSFLIDRLVERTLG